MNDTYRLYRDSSQGGKPLVPDAEVGLTFGPSKVVATDAHDELLAAAAEPGGTTCPTCHQHAQIYDRRIHAGMAAALIVMYRKAGITETFKMPDLAKRWRSRDESHLEHWGLIRRLDGGRWEVTIRGAEFARGIRTVPEVARIYNGELLDFAGPQVTIYDCLGRKFDYHTLMYGERA